MRSDFHNWLDWAIDVVKASPDKVLEYENIIVSRCGDRIRIDIRGVF